MLNNVLLKELANKIESCNTCVSVAYNSNNITSLNIIEPDELTITENEIVIESNNLFTNIPIHDECDVFKNENEIEDEYILKNKEMELYISMV